MVINRTALWVLIVLCCVPGVALVVRARLRQAWPPLAAWADGVMVGIGVGLGVSCVVLAGAALWVTLF